MRFVGVILILGIVFSFSFITSCNKDDVSPDQKDPDVDDLNPSIPVDSGSIGLVIDTRLIAKLGYEPSKVSVNFSDDYSDYSDEIDVNPATNIAVFKIDHDDVSKEKREGFADGVNLNLVVKNNTGGELSNQSFVNQSVDASNSPVIMETDLPAKLPELSLAAGTPYLLQSEATNQIITSVSINVISFPPYPRGIGTTDYISEGDSYQQFYFEKYEGGEESEYIMLSYNNYLVSGYPLGQTTTEYEYVSHSNYSPLIIELLEGGWVRIKMEGGGYYKEIPEGDPDYLNGYSIVEGTDTDYTRFRLISADITWTLIDRGIEFDQPILPPAKLEFAYNARLTNCSSASLTETVGRDESRSQTTTTGFEESLELFTSHEASVEVKAGVEVDAEFFGNGATYNFEVTAGYKYTTSETNTTTNYWEESTTTEIEISRERTVELVPNSAIEVYDAIQTLENVRVPFTKSFRLQGEDGNGNKIKGEDIQFQLFANRFEGVVSFIGEDYVDFTVKGTTLVDRMLEVETKVSEIDGACD
ncbi:MAG: hypothetical protein ACP5E3_04040 [Bacteroidales bacterium]